MMKNLKKPMPLLIKYKNRYLFVCQRFFKFFIIRKQNRDINNREIYAYLHDIFGPSTLDLFDIHYEDEDVEEDSAQNKQNDTKESQKEEES